MCGSIAIPWPLARITFAGENRRVRIRHPILSSSLVQYDPIRSTIRVFPVLARALGENAAPPKAAAERQGRIDLHRRLRSFTSSVCECCKN